MEILEFEGGGGGELMLERLVRLKAREKFWEKMDVLDTYHVSVTAISASFKASSGELVRMTLSE